MVVTTEWADVERSGREAIRHMAFAGILLIHRDINRVPHPLNDFIVGHEESVGIVGVDLLDPTFQKLTRGLCHGFYVDSQRGTVAVVSALKVLLHLQSDVLNVWNRRGSVVRSIEESIHRNLPKARKRLSLVAVAPDVSIKRIQGEGPVVVPAVVRRYNVIRHNTGIVENTESM
jgi:hypothetical protein